MYGIRKGNRPPNDDQYRRFLQELRRNLEAQLRAQRKAEVRAQAQERAQGACQQMQERVRQSGSMLQMNQAAAAGLPDPRLQAGEHRALSAPTEVGVSPERFAADLERMFDQLSARFSPSTVAAAIRDFERNPASSMIDNGVSVGVSLLTGPVGGLYNLAARAVEFVSGVDLPTFDDLSRALRSFASGFFEKLNGSMSRFFARVGTSTGLTEPSDYYSEELGMCFGSRHDLAAAETAAKEDALSGTCEQEQGFDLDSFGTEDTCEATSSNETL